VNESATFNILPFALSLTDDAGVQASPTQIVLWPYTDLTDRAQLYWDRRFTELETLGGWVELLPGMSAEHVESWELRRVGRGDQYAGWISPSI